MTHRRREITSPHVPGNWLISAQPDNVTENVVVWVNEFDHFALWKAVDALEVAFTQPQFIMRWQVDQHEWAWSCQLADYQITTDQPLMHATMAKFTVRVPRHPQVVHALAGLLPKVPGGRAYTTANGTFTAAGRDLLVSSLFNDGVTLPNMWIGLLLGVPEPDDNGDSVYEVPTETIDQATMVSVATGYERVFTSRVAPTTVHCGCRRATATRCTWRLWRSRQRRSTGDSWCRGVVHR